MMTSELRAVVFSVCALAVMIVLACAGCDSEPSGPDDVPPAPARDPVAVTDACGELAVAWCDSRTEDCGHARRADCISIVTDICVDANNYHDITEIPGARVDECIDTVEERGVCHGVTRECAWFNAEASAPARRSAGG